MSGAGSQSEHSTQTTESSARAIVPGEVIAGDSALTLNASLEVAKVEVINAGDRPVQVGSHFHFAECNRALQFDREQAWGKRLDIPAGTATRFEPGIENTVELVPIGGARVVQGLNRLAGGKLDAVIRGELKESI